MAETEHSNRRDLAHFLIDSLQGRSSATYEVHTREIPSRSILCLKRNVDGQAGAWAFGKEFIALLRDHPLPRMDGIAGAVYCIWWGEVSDDSGGPLEWCRPVPDDQSESLAAGFPELSLRVEPAHREAFVNIGAGGETSSAQWPLITEALHSWGDEEEVQPCDLSIRITYLAPLPRTDDSTPDYDFAVPFQ